MKSLFQRLALFIFIFSLLLGCRKGEKELVFATVEDFKEAKIAVLTGSTQDAYVHEHFPNAQVQRLDLVPDVFLSLKNKKCDLVFVDYLAYKLNYEEDKSLSVIVPNLFPGNCGVGFQKEDNTLRLEFNKFLKTIRSNGVYDQMRSRWLDSLDTARMPDVSLAGCSGEPIKVGIVGSNPPFDFVLDGKNSGFDIELMTRFAAEIGRPIEFSIINFGGLIASLSSGMVDAITATITITPERSKHIAFSDPYYEGESCVVVRTENAPQGLTCLDDAAEKTIAVLLGSSQDFFITERYPKANILRIPDAAQLILTLRSGKCDVGILSELEANAAVELTQDLSILEQQVFATNIAAAFEKNDKELLGAFNVFLEKMKSGGVYDSIVHKWMDNPQTRQVPAFQYAKHGKPLLVGTTGTTVPFSFMQENVLAGIDVEIARRFAAYLGRDIEFSIINFDALIPSLSSGKVDMAINNIMVTPEREKEVNFSHPYYQSQTSALALKSRCASNILSLMTKSGDREGEEKGFFATIKESFINNLVVEKRYMLILNGLWETVRISFFAILLGTLLGVGICFLRTSKQQVISGFAKGYIALMRGTPMLVLLMIVFYVIFAKTSVSATFVAILSFSLNFSAYVSEIFRSSLEGIDRGQREAGIAIGFSPIKTFRYIILPQAWKRAQPIFKGEAISLVKMTSIVGYIAVQDLTKASDLIRSRTFDAFFPLIVITILYFLLAWLLGKALELFSFQHTH